MDVTETKGYKIGAKIGLFHILTILLVLLKVLGLTTISWFYAFLPSVIIFGLVITILAFTLLFVVLMLLISIFV